MREESAIMKMDKRIFLTVFFQVLLFLIFVLLPGMIYGGEYPMKPISIYCSYDAGGSTDLTARALAREGEKFLGVPLVVENKAGGGGTVCCSLLTSKKPDGYTLGVIGTSPLTTNPHIMQLSYNGFKDFAPIIGYSAYISGLVVLKDSPYKNIYDFIEHAKKHPGIAYGSTGMYGQSHLSMVNFMKCKGLELKHVPFKGGAPASIALMGNHVDLITSGDRSIQYVKKGVMRLLLNFNLEARDPQYPDVPIVRDIGCNDLPCTRMIVLGPKGIPDTVSHKLEDAFKKASETDTFQKVLKGLDCPYAFVGRTQLEEALVKEDEAYRNALREMGVKKGEK